MWLSGTAYSGATGAVLGGTPIECSNNVVAAGVVVCDDISQIQFTDIQAWGA